MPEPAQRIDKWLWSARFIKSRARAAALVNTGRIRRNGERISKPGQKIRPDDVLTFALNKHIRVIRVLQLATRRGPYSEAVLLYEDLAPPQAGKPSPENSSATLSPARREPGTGRPTKKQRRELQIFIDRD